MNKVRQKKLAWVVFFLVILGLVAALVLYALKQNINLFFSPSQIVAGDAPFKRSIRLGGMVKKDSLQREEKSLTVRFQVTDFKKTIWVSYTGILPDLFREGQGIVAEGQLLDKKHFKASQVLAKHDENYMPREVKELLSPKAGV